MDNAHDTEKRRTRKQKAVRFFVRLFAWGGAAILYYILFSFFFDTPHEYRMRHSTDKLRTEYDVLAARYDSLEMVLDNITDRDRSVFRILFESDPYDLDTEQSEERVALHEKKISESRRELRRDLDRRTDEMTEKIAALEDSYLKLKLLGDSLGDRSNAIPSIQPVLNKQLTLLTAGYGTILNPFYRTPKSHQGVDYTVAEGSSIFATADGVVKEISDASAKASNIRQELDAGKDRRHRPRKRLPNIVQPSDERIGAPRTESAARRRDSSVGKLGTLARAASALRGALQRPESRSRALLLHGTYPRRISAHNTHRPIGNAVVRLTRADEYRRDFAPRT